MMKLNDDYVELTLHLGRSLYRALDDDDRQLAHLLTMALTHVDAKYGRERTLQCHAQAHELRHERASPQR